MKLGGQIRGQLNVRAPNGKHLRVAVCHPACVEHHFESADVLEGGLHRLEVAPAVLIPYAGCCYSSLASIFSQCSHLNSNIHSLLCKDSISVMSTSAFVCPSDVIVLHWKLKLPAVDDSLLFLLNDART